MVEYCCNCRLRSGVVRIHAGVCGVNASTMPAQSCSCFTSRKHDAICAAKNWQAFPQHGQEVDVFQLAAPSLIREAGPYILCVLYACVSSCTQLLRVQHQALWRNRTTSRPCKTVDSRFSDQRHSLPFAACCQRGCFGGLIVVGSAQPVAVPVPAADGVRSPCTL